MKALELSRIAFSVAWPRVFPQGDAVLGTPKVWTLQPPVDELLANDIRPFATLYHWDLPQPLQDNGGGGWESRADTSKACLR